MKYSLWNMVARGGDGGGGGGGNKDSGYTDLGNGYSITPSGDVVSTRDTPLGGGGRDTSMDRANIYDVPAGPPMPTTMQTGGGGGRESPAYSSPTSDNTVAALNAQRAAQEAAAQQAADKAAADNAARIAAERAAYQPPAPEAPSLGLGDIAATLFGITPAEAKSKPITTPEEFAAAQAAIAAAKQTGLTGGVPIGYKSPEQIAKEADLAENQAQAAIDAAALRTGFGTVPGIYDPTTGYITTPEGKRVTNYPVDVSSADIDRAMANISAAQTVPTEKTIPQMIADFVNPSGESLKYTSKYTLPDVGLRIGQEGTAAITTAKPSPFEAFTQATTSPQPFPDSIPPSPTASPYTYALASIINATKQEDAAAQAKKQEDAAKTAAIIASANPLPALVGKPANVPMPLARPEDLGITEEAVAEPAESVAAKVAKAAAPQVTTAATTAPKSIVDLIQDANAARIAELEKAGKFAGGSKEQVAAALGVDPSQLQSRIVNYDGQQKVDYFTKGLDQVLGEMISGPAQALGNLFGSNVNNIPRGSYVRDPRLSDLFTQNVPSKGYGPYGDLTAEEYRQQYGGRDASQVAQAPVTPPVTQPVTPAPPTPAPPLAQTAWSRTRTGLPFDPYRYGYGGEYTYYSAEGGPVSPLNKARK